MGCGYVFLTLTSPVSFSFSIRLSTFSFGPAHKRRNSGHSSSGSFLRYTERQRKTADHILIQTKTYLNLTRKGASYEANTPKVNTRLIFLTGSTFLRQHGQLELLRTMSTLCNKLWQCNCLTICPISKAPWTEINHEQLWELQAFKLNYNI